MHVVECISDTRDELGESPIWIEEENSIYWVDIKRFLIHNPFSFLISLRIKRIKM